MRKTVFRSSVKIELKEGEKVKIIILIGEESLDLVKKAQIRGYF